jgi:hypothetical protein
MILRAALDFGDWRAGISHGFPTNVPTSYPTRLHQATANPLIGLTSANCSMLWTTIKWFRYTSERPLRAADLLASVTGDTDRISVHHAAYARRSH